MKFHIIKFEEAKKLWMRILLYLVNNDKSTIGLYNIYIIFPENIN
jgi:hypothetical protein